MGLSKITLKTGDGALRHGLIFGQFDALAIGVSPPIAGAENR
jgi:hypothetical protein